MILATIMLVPMLAIGASFALPSASVFAADDTDISGGMGDGADASRGAGQADQLFGADGIFTTLINVLLYVIGAISVLMLIYGGIRYTISGGDSAAVTAAKNTILYAVIGIVVSLLAYAIVNFVISQMTTA